MEGKKIPGELLQSLRGVEGFNQKSFIDVHESGEQVVSIRVNAQKLALPPFENCQPVPWSSSGYYLPHRPSFTLDPLLHAGAYYVQEASGMFLEQCIKQTTDLRSPLKVLDLCAAPGGKSTLLQSTITSESLLVSNEAIKTRVGILEENMTKWGGSNVIVTNNDPRDFSRLPGFFNVMVVDAPCSGSGLFRKDPDAITEWSTQAVQTCALRQQRILTDAYSCLQQNGVLVYATCSYSPEENEQICNWLVQTFDLTPLKIAIDPSWNIIETETDGRAYSYRFFPDKLKGEGFFISCFRKNDGTVSDMRQPGKTKLAPATKSEISVAGLWLSADAHLQLWRHSDELLALPASVNAQLPIIQSALYVKKAGVHIGKVVRNEFLPAHALALSGLCSDQLLRISLKRDEALQYLRKEEVTIQSKEKGWALVDYEGQHLGWIKLLGNRANNYYPKEWRILKSGND